MILSNKFVQIRTNQRNITTHNYIYDRYLEFVNRSQFKTSTENDIRKYNSKKLITNCFLKFDTPINDYSNLTNTDFDACIQMLKYDVTGNGNQCNCTYIYDSTNSFCDPTDVNVNLDIADYIGKKITAIGFFNNWYEEVEEEQWEWQPDILAFLDVNDYGIYVAENEKIIITRSDDFNSNMQCTGIDFPKHLAPYYMYYTDTGNDIEMSPVYSRLYSIGFGGSKGMMLEEYKLDNDEITIDLTDNNFSFWIKTGEKHVWYPRSTWYPGNSMYPTKDYQRIEQYPSETFYPTTNKYPMKANVKYIIFKYMLCCYDYEDNLVDIGTTYTMNFYSPLIAYYKVINKIERRD